MISMFALSFFIVGAFAQVPYGIQKCLRHYVAQGRIRDSAWCAAGGKGLVQTRFGCFKVVKTYMKSELARKHCLSLGMDLASFEKTNSKADLDELASSLDLEKGHWYAIGLLQDPSEGAWRWPSRAEMAADSALWADTEPNDANGGEEFGYLSAFLGLYDGKDFSEKFICSLQ